MRRTPARSESTVRDIQSASLDSIGRSIVLAMHNSHFQRNHSLQLLYFRPEAMPAEVATAVALVELEPVLARFPRGLDAGIGEEGVTLSNGQRQRIALARTIRGGLAHDTRRGSSSIDADSRFGF